MPFLIDRVKDTTTTTGTGAITVSGTPATGYGAFSQITTGTVIDYTIVGGSEYETGRGKTTSSTAFSRDQVQQSSNSDALVNFSAGTKDVFVTVSSASINTRGRMIAMPLTLR